MPNNQGDVYKRQGMHLLYAGDVAAVTFLISLYFLFKSYQQPRPAVSYTHLDVYKRQGESPVTFRKLSVKWLLLQKFRILLISRTL